MVWHCMSAKISIIKLFIFKSVLKIGKMLMLVVRNLA